MTKWVFVLAALSLVACSNDCDNSDASISFSHTCVAKNGGGGNGGGNGGSNGLGGNGGGKEAVGGNGNGGSNVSGGTTITYDYSGVTPPMPKSVMATAKYQNSPGILIAGNSLIFTASMVNGKFEPKLPGGVMQIFLSRAEAFQVISPDTTGCELTDKEWGFAGINTSVIQFALPASDACKNVTAQMKTLGFQVLFTNVPASDGSIVANVTYVVKP